MKSAFVWSPAVSDTVERRFLSCLPEVDGRSKFSSLAAIKLIVLTAASIQFRQLFPGGSAYIQAVLMRDNYHIYVTIRRDGYTNCYTIRFRCERLTQWGTLFVFRPFGPDIEIPIQLTKLIDNKTPGE